MPIINEAEIKNQIKTNTLQKVYLIYGDEAFLKQHYVTSIENTAVTNARDFNLARLDGKDLKVNDLFDICESVPLMNPKRCVTISDFDPEKTTADELNRLDQLLDDPPPTCVIIFWCDAVCFNAKRPGKWRNIIKKINKTGATLDLPYRDAVSLAKTLCSSAKKRGCEMDFNTASYMVTRCGVDLFNLQSELDKVCAYKKSGKINDEDINLLTNQSLDFTSFQLVDAINTKNADKAMEILSVLVNNRVEPIMILSAIISGYADVYRAKLAITANKSIDEAASDFGYKGKEFKLRNAVSIAHRVDITLLRSCNDILDEADRMLKSSPVDNTVVLEQCVVKLLRANKT